MNDSDLNLYDNGRLLMRFMHAGKDFILVALLDDSQAVAQWILSEVVTVNGDKTYASDSRATFVTLKDTDTPEQSWQNHNAKLNKFLAKYGDPTKPLTMIEKHIKFFREQIKFQAGKLVKVS